jgi:hypothetical protein
MSRLLTGNSIVNGEKKKSGLIRKYGLNMSRQAFREKAADMGWVKVCGKTYGVGPMAKKGQYR